MFWEVEGCFQPQALGHIVLPAQVALQPFPLLGNEPCKVDAVGSRAGVSEEQWVTGPAIPTLKLEKGPPASPQ